MRTRKALSENLRLRQAHALRRSISWWRQQVQGTRPAFLLSLSLSLSLPLSASTFSMHLPLRLAVVSLAWMKTKVDHSCLFDSHKERCIVCLIDRATRLSQERHVESESHPNLRGLQPKSVQ